MTLDEILNSTEFEDFMKQADKVTPLNREVVDLIVYFDLDDKHDGGYNGHRKERKYYYQSTNGNQTNGLTLIADNLGNLKDYRLTTRYIY